MTKEDIFSLINVKDYNNVLEQILEKKDFSEDVKNLLLSMLYKIENSYKDYEKVNKLVENKNKFIKELLNTINECRKILIAKSNSKEEELLKKENKKYLIDREKEEIIVYQNEEVMLKALLEYSYSEIKVKDEYVFFSKAIKELFKEGYIQNKLEVIRDFNGWSWDINEKQIDNKAYNLIYKNMLIILGNEFIDEIIYENNEEENMPSNEILRSKYEEKKYYDELKVDYIEEIYEEIETYGKELKEQIKEDIKKAIIYVIYNTNKEEKEKIEKEKEEVNILLTKMQNKEAFLEEQTKIKKEMSLEIKNIDNIISDEKNLKEDYEKYNSLVPNNKKVFSPSKYANILIGKRRQLLNKIEEINKMMNPIEFVKIKEELENKNQFFSSLHQDGNKIIENLEIDFLKIFNKQIEEIETKSEIIDYIYYLRYYNFIPYIEDKTVNQVEELKKYLEETQKLLIKKACEKKVINRLSQEDEINYEILKNIFTSKIVELEEMIIILKYNKDILTVEIYDGNIMENSINIKIKTKTELSVRLKRKIKIFI